MIKEQFNQVFIFSFSYVLYKKNKRRLHTTYPKRGMPLKASKSLFFERHLWQSLIVVTTLGMSRAKLRIRLK